MLCAPELHHVPLRSAAGGDARDLLGYGSGLLGSGDEHGDPSQACATLLNSRATSRCQLRLHKRMHRCRRAHPGKQLRRHAAASSASRGTLPNDWHWDVVWKLGTAARACSCRTATSRAQRLQAALNNAAVYASQGCALFNPFGEGNLTPACGNAVSDQDLEPARDRADRTSWVRSPAICSTCRPVRSQFAAGAEYREQRGRLPSGLVPVER